jgi:hypothetical protein
MGIPIAAKALLTLTAAPALAAAALAQPAIAASPEVSGALVKEAGAACQIASELENPRVVWSSPDYEQKVAVIVAGTPKQELAEGGDKSSVLCLFDKQSAKVEIQEMDPKLFD